MIDGTWVLTLDTPIGRLSMDLTVSVSGGEVSGKINGPNNSDAPISDATFSGDELRFSAFVQSPAGPTNISAYLKLAGDSLNGSFGTSFGSFTVAGVRK